MTPLIVEGVPRSGTRFFCKFIEKQFNIKIFRIQNEIVSYYKIVKNYHAMSREEVLALLKRIVNEYNFKNRVGEVDPDSLELTNIESSFGTILGKLLDRKSKELGFSGWGLKFDNPSGMPSCHFLFPESKVVHILRDGRDVNLSACQCLNEGYHSPILNANFWKSEILNRRKISVIFDPKDYFEIKYEDILSDPVKSFQALGDFLNYDDVEYKQIRIKKTNFNKWKERMSENDIRLYEELAGDLLFELGYSSSGFEGKKVPIALMKIHSWMEPFMIFKMYVIQFLSKRTRHRDVHKIKLKTSRIRRRMNL